MVTSHDDEMATPDLTLTTRSSIRSNMNISFSLFVPVHSGAKRYFLFQLNSASLIRFGITDCEL